MEGAVEVAILVIPTLPFVRLTACRPFQRRLGGAPEVAVGLCGALLAYGLTVAVVAMWAPVLLRPLAALAIVAVAVAWWRARPGYGRARGLPPGSLAVAPVRPWVDHGFYLDQSARHGPVFKTSTIVAPTICVVGWPLAQDLFAGHDAALDTPPARFSRFIPRGFLRYMSIEDHARYSVILRSAISGAATHRAEAEIRAIVRRELSRAAAITGADASRGIDAHALSAEVSFVAFMRLFFGVGPDDPAIPRLRALYRSLDPRRAWRVRPRRVGAALDEVVAIICGRPQTDSFLQAARIAHPEAADDETLLKNLAYLAQTSGADLSGLLAWVLWMLGLEPEWLALVRDRDQPGQLARRVVMETLRLEQSEYIARRAAREIRWGGYVIPRGWRVRICVRESHRDATIFPDPDRFLPERPSAPHGSYAAFGTPATRTSCLGEGLTLTVGRILVEELAGGFDLFVANDGPPEFSGYHWQPSARFRVGLSPR